MEVDGATVTAVGAVVTPVVFAIGRVLYKDRAEVLSQHRECEQKHAAEQYRIGSLESALSFLATTQGPEVQEKVDRMLAEGNERAEEIKTTIIATKKGRTKD